MDSGIAPRLGAVQRVKEREGVRHAETDAGHRERDGLKSCCGRLRCPQSAEGDQRNCQDEGAPSLLPSFKPREDHECEGLKGPKRHKKLSLHREGNMMRRGEQWIEIAYVGAQKEACEINDPGRQ